MDTVGRGRPRAADRLHQPGESAARPSGGATKEMALRSAIGASAWRIGRQLLTESLYPSPAGGGLGVAIGVCRDRVRTPARGVSIPSSRKVEMNATALVVAGGVSVSRRCVFGLAPAIAARAATPERPSRPGGCGWSDGRPSAHESALVPSCPKWRSPACSRLQPACRLRSFLHVPASTSDSSPIGLTRSASTPVRRSIRRTRLRAYMRRVRAAAARRAGDPTPRPLPTPSRSTVSECGASRKVNRPTRPSAR